MAGRITLTAALLLALAGLCPAQETGGEKLLGTWILQAGDFEITLTIQPQVMRCALRSVEGHTTTMDADYLTTADGHLAGFLRRPSFGKSGNADEEEKDRLFSCRIRITGNTLIVSKVNASLLKKDSVLFEGRYVRAAETPPIVPRSGRNRILGKGLSHLPSNSNRRITELINNSEDLRQKEYEWERIRITDQPPHLKPERVHGGIQ